MSLQHLILGVLKYGPLSGYDLNKAFEASVQHFWDTDQSLIYRALYKMHERGWVEVEVVTQKDLPAKKLYRLTETGRSELLHWLETPRPIPALHEGWLGQLFFSAELTPEQIRLLLETRIAEVKAILTHYENDVPAGATYYADLYQAQGDVAYWLLTLDYGIQKMRFDLQWAERALQQVAQITGENQPPDKTDNTA
jgi:PadR family transcriptional regulator, regulatory protein AphA